MSSTVFLYWPPWTGKSTIGKTIALDQGMNHIDMDSIIKEGEWGASEIIAQYGIEYFREVETRYLMDIVSKVSQKQSCVVSLGGWSLLRRENQWIIQTIKWKIVVLTWIPHLLWERILADKTNNRPLVKTREAFMELMKERSPHYQSFRTRIYVDDKTVDEVVKEVLKYTSLSIPSPELRSP